MDFLDFRGDLRIYRLNKVSIGSNKLKLGVSDKSEV